MIDKLLQMIIVAILNWMASKAQKEVALVVEEIKKGKADAKTNEANAAKYNEALGRSARAIAALDLLNRTPTSSN